MLITGFVFAVIAILPSSKMKSQKAYCVIIGSLLFLLLACRSEMLGAVDTQWFIQYFNEYSSMEFRDILLIQEKDVGFHILGRLFSIVINNDRAWLCFLAAISIITITFMIYKNSVSPKFSYIIYYVFNFYFVNFYLLRQMLAMSVLLIAGMLLIKAEKNSFKLLLQFFLLVILATCFHKSAFIFVIAYPLKFIKLNWKMYLGLIIIAAIVIFSPEIILQGIQTFFTDERFLHYGLENRGIVFSWLNVILNIIVFAFCVYGKKKVIKNVQGANFYYNMLTIGLTFTFMSSVVAEFFRIALYFQVYQILLVPLVIRYGFSSNNRISTSSRFQVSLSVGTMFMLYFLTRSEIFSCGYYVFWE